MTRLLYYPVSYFQCGGSEVKAMELVPAFRGDKWYCVERDDCHDMFKIWHIIGDYH